MDVAQTVAAAEAELQLLWDVANSLSHQLEVQRHIDEEECEEEDWQASLRESSGVDSAGTVQQKLQALSGIATGLRHTCVTLSERLGMKRKANGTCVAPRKGRAVDVPEPQQVTKALEVMTAADFSPAVSHAALSCADVSMWDQSRRRRRRASGGSVCTLIINND
eukprot:TRINITY_DN876_c0_g2_i3.p1 TRINITY_DN876_c0_g2~~TRINITY_DN876_c0_g2_i3.p1  ORF type:complete len:186 (+),score=61.79 TRINITY_DN876_c0_g2_i3:65-559(+)